MAILKGPSSVDVVDARNKDRLSILAVMGVKNFLK